MTHPEHPNANLLDYCEQSLRILKSRLATFWAIAAILILGAILAAYGRSPKYETHAKIVVKLDLQTFVLSPSEVRYNLATKMADEAVGNQVELLHSSELIQRVIDVVGEDVLASKPGNPIVAAILSAVNGVKNAATEALISLRLIDRLSPRQQLAQTIELGLKILPAKKSQTIDITLRLKNPIAAQKILAALISEHLKKIQALENNVQTDATYDQQTAQLRADLESREAAVSEFKNKYQFIDLEVEKSTALHSAMQLQKILDGLQDAGAAAATNSVFNATAEDSRSDKDLSDAASLANRLDNLRIELKGRAAMYAPGHVKLDEIQEQVKTTEQLLNSKIRRLRETSERYWARSRTLDGLTPEYTRLQRDLQVHEALYRTYLQATEGQRLANAIDLHPQVAVIDPPNLPQSAVAPSRLLMVLGGIIGGLILAALAVLLLHWRSAQGASKSLAVPSLPLE